MNQPRRTPAAPSALALLGAALVAGCAAPPSTPPRENSAALCANGRDDDDDGFADCDDQDCLRVATCSDAGHAENGAAHDATPTDVPPTDVPPTDATPTDAPPLDAPLPDARLTDSGGPADGAPTAPPRCAQACDCPAGTTCTVAGVCEGTACAQACNDEYPCPCGRACRDGFCEPFAGSLAACRASCECPRGQFCAAGRCVRACGFRQFNCENNEPCAACGTTCDTYTARCRPENECSCSARCPRTAGACVGERCVAPAGRRYDPQPGQVPFDAPPPSELPDPQVSFDVPAGVRVRRVALAVVLRGGLSAFAPLSIVLLHPSGEPVAVAPAGASGGPGDCTQGGRQRAVFPLTNPLQAPGFSALEGGRSGAGTWRLRIVDSFSGASGTSLIEDVALYLEAE